MSNLLWRNVDLRIKNIIWVIFCFFFSIVLCKLRELPNNNEIKLQNSTYQYLYFSSFLVGVWKCPIMGRLKFNNWNKINMHDYNKTNVEIPFKSFSCTWNWMFYEHAKSVKWVFSGVFLLKHFLALLNEPF